MVVDLAFAEFGSGEPVVVLHGLFGSKRNWAGIAARLGERRRVCTVDLRNHGESPWDPVHDYPAMADDVARLIDTKLGRPAAVIGHSMGGKAAMMLALARPELVERLVVVDIAPARSAGGPLGFLRSMREVPLADCSRRAEVEKALAATIPEPAVRAFLVQNVVAREGKLAWGINLEALEHNADAIVGFPDVPPNAAFPKPTLFVAGGGSDYLRPAHVPQIERLFPAATTNVIEAAGHWVHADAPEAFLEAVDGFLNA